MHINIGILTSAGNTGLNTQQVMALTTLAVAGTIFVATCIDINLKVPATAKRRSRKGSSR